MFQTETNELEAKKSPLFGGVFSFLFEVLFAGFFGAKKPMEFGFVLWHRPSKDSAFVSFDPKLLFRAVFLAELFIHGHKIRE